MIGIYKITNQLNGKCYIGQSVNIENRWKQHVYEGTHNRKNNKFYNAIKKYGIENFLFEIIEECSLSSNELDQRERYWINYYDSFNNGYNSTLGGQGEDSWVYDPNLIHQLWDEGYSVQEIKQIVGCGATTIQNNLKNYKDYNNNTSHLRGWIYASKKGRMGILKPNTVYSVNNSNDENNDKIAYTYFGPVVPIYQYSLLGKYIQSFPSIEAAARNLHLKYPSAISQASLSNERKTAYGYQWSRKKVESLPPVPVPHGRLVKCLNTGEIFTSAAEAAKKYNIKSPTNISECCIGKRHSAGKLPNTNEKLYWEYY